MLDSVGSQLGLVVYMSGRSFYYNIVIGMGLEAPTSISDIPFEINFDVVRQTCNHILQMSASHQAILHRHVVFHCQILVVPWRVLSAQQVLLAPVYIFNSQQDNKLTASFYGNFVQITEKIAGKTQDGPPQLHHPPHIFDMNWGYTSFYSIWLYKA